MGLGCALSEASICSDVHETAWQQQVPTRAEDDSHTVRRASSCGKGSTLRLGASDSGLRMQRIPKCRQWPAVVDHTVMAGPIAKPVMKGVRVVTVQSSLLPSPLFRRDRARRVSARSFARKLRLALETFLRRRIHRR